MKSQNMNRACALVVMASFQPITRGKSDMMKLLCRLLVSKTIGPFAMPSLFKKDACSIPPTKKRSFLGMKTYRIRVKES